MRLSFVLLSVVSCALVVGSVVVVVGIVAVVVVVVVVVVGVVVVVSVSLAVLASVLQHEAGTVWGLLTFAACQAVPRICSCVSAGGGASSGRGAGT